MRMVPKAVCEEAELSPYLVLGEGHGWSGQTTECSANHGRSLPISPLLSVRSLFYLDSWAYIKVRAWSCSSNIPYVNPGPGVRVSSIFFPSFSLF